jgi:glycosyltransferase involved in cell wall biosynthesis
VVHTYHGHVFHGYFGRLTSAAYRRVEQALSLVTDCLVAVSDATARDLRRLGVGTPDKIRVVRLGLDLEPFAGSPPEGGRSLRRLVGAQERDLLAVTIGRLVHIKRIDLALSAVAEAVALGVPVRLAVVGDGPLRPELEAWARDLGVADRVTFLGYRSDLDVIAAAADVALLTSDAEGTPVSLIEMGASGRPAIATDVGGVREVVTDASGLVVPAGNASAIAQALATLAEDADRRREMGRAARQHTTSRFGASRLLDDVDLMYRQLLNPHATSPRG